MKYKFILFSPWLLKSPVKGTLSMFGGISLEKQAWSLQTRGLTFGCLGF